MMPDNRTIRTQRRFPCSSALLFACFTLCTSVSPVAAQNTITKPKPAVFLPSAPVNPGNITEAMRKEDPRLQQRVTIRESRVYVGELLEMLQAKTGIVLSASDKDKAAGEQVAIFVQDVPLSDLMEALWSLFSYQKAERIWQREGDSKTGDYQYRFLRPTSVDELASKLKQDIQKDFEAEADKFIKAAKMPPEELKVAAERDPRLKYVAENARGRAGLQALSDTLSQEQLKNVLHGKDTLTFSMAQLTPSGKTFVTIARDQQKNWNPNMTVSESKYIRVTRRIFPGEITPALFIVVDPFGGFAYVGGMPMENKWRGDLADLWLQPGDTSTDAEKEKATIPTSNPSQSKVALYDDTNGRERMGRRLAQLTDASPSISVLARWPIRPIHASEHDIQSPYNRTLADILNRFIDFGQPHKWRRDVLLVGCDNWFNNANAEDEAAQNAYISWTLVKKLREEETKNRGFLTIESLLWASANLTKGERERLAFEEFPSLASVDEQPKQLKLLMTYLGGARADYRTQVCSPRGLSIQRVPEEVATAMQSMAKLLGATEPVTAIRLEDSLTQEKRPTILEKEAPVRRIKFIFLGKTGEPLGQGTYMEMYYPGRTLAESETKQATQAH